MKHHSEKRKGIVREYQSLALTAALLLPSCFTNLCQAAPPASASPVGTWDIVSTGGGQQGLAYLTFTTDLDSLGNFTFHGYVLVAGTLPVVVPQSSYSNPRNSGGADSRGGSSSNTNSSAAPATTPNTTLYGFSDISGPWRYDINNHVIGFFTEPINVVANVTNYLATNVLETITNPSDPSESTNIPVVFSDTQPIAVINYLWPINNYLATNVLETITNPSNTSESTIILVVFANGQQTAGTNYFWPTTMNTQLYEFPNPNVVVSLTNERYEFPNPNVVVIEGSVEKTNAISFVGKAVAGKRLTLVSSTSFGKVNYTGIPAVALTDFSGSSWSGMKRSNGQFFVEFFNMSSPGDASYPNIYPVSGAGPGYSLQGHAMISAQKKIGFSVRANGVLRASVGSFNLNARNGTAKATTKGIEQPGSAINFNASLLSLPAGP